MSLAFTIEFHLRLDGLRPNWPIITYRYLDDLRRRFGSFPFAFIGTDGVLLWRNLQKVGQSGYLMISAYDLREGSESIIPTITLRLSLSSILAELLKRNWPSQSENNPGDAVRFSS